MMSKSTAAAVICLLGSASALSRTDGVSASGFLASKSGLQPEVVAHSLVRVENEWRAQAGAFLECNATSPEHGAECTEAKLLFVKSCATVASAMLQASNGDRGVVKEYMGLVCNTAELQTWRQDTCNNLATLVTKAMTATSLWNRGGLNASTVCLRYWPSFLQQELATRKQERLEREAEARRLAAERAAQAERAASEKAAEELRRQQEAVDEAKRLQAELAAAAVQAEVRANISATPLANTTAAAVAVAPGASAPAANATASTAPLLAAPALNGTAAAVIVAAKAEAPVLDAPSLNASAVVAAPVVDAKVTVMASKVSPTP